MNKDEIPKSINEVFKRVLDIGRFKKQEDMIPKLAINRRHFFKVKKEEHYLSDENARKLAEIAELPIDYVLTLNNVERCKDVEAIEAYKNILRLLEHLHTKNR